MKRERINKLLQNETQISNAERNLASALAKVQHWQSRLDKLRKDELRIRLESHLPLGPSTRKNQRKYLVWATIRALLKEPLHQAGMTTAELDPPPDWYSFISRLRSGYGPRWTVLQTRLV